MAQTKSSPVRHPTKSDGKSKSGMAENTQLEKFFEDALKDIYWAEKHLVKALGKMQKSATTEELQESIEDHREQTEEHVSRLEQVFEMLGKRAQAKKCEAIEGLTKEADEVISQTDSGSLTRDVGIIVSAQKVEHYEISAYGSIIQLAKVLGQDDVAEILGQTLEEEKAADRHLTEVAQNNINWEAAQEGGE